MSEPRTPAQIAYEIYGMCRSNLSLLVWEAQTPEVQATWAAVAAAVLAHTIPQSFEEKTALNAWAAARYDALIHEGKHGHYETMFRVIQEALKRHQPDDIMHAYAAIGGRCCPACGGADIANGNDTTFTVCAIRRVMLCEDCGAGWKAVYTLSGYEDLRLPIKEGP